MRVRRIVIGHLEEEEEEEESMAGVRKYSRWGDFSNLWDLRTQAVSGFQ